MHTARNERQQQMHRVRTAVGAQLVRSAGPRKTGGPGKATALETSGRENRLRPLFSWPTTRHALVGPNGSATPMHWRAPDPATTTTKSTHGMQQHRKIEAEDEITYQSTSGTKQAKHRHKGIPSSKPNIP